MTGCTGGTPAGGHSSAREVAAKKPVKFLSVSPAPGATGVNGASAITVTYSAPLPASAPFPSLSPAIAGTWQRRGDTAVFTPEAGFPPKTRVTVTIPAVATSAAGGSSATASGLGASGTASARTASAAGAITASFTTGSYSALRLQEVLAQLGYLPLTWSPAPGKAATVALTARQEVADAYHPPAGSFTWASGYPSRLHSFWAPGSLNILTRGAVTGFEGDHGLPIDGNTGSTVWAALLTAALQGQANTQGYSYAITDEHSPETLTIWHDGKLAFHSLANTGISIEPTPIGTFPVFEKLPFQIMSGTNPDGSHYADPVQWVSYFVGGSAVHYFPRYSFGSPQSLGCVELPYSAAKQAYPLLPYGTLVTVLAS